VGGVGHLVRRQQHLDGRCGEVLALVAELGRRRLVQVGDQPRRVDADDGVGRGVEQFQERIARKVLVGRHKDEVSHRVNRSSRPTS